MNKLIPLEVLSCFGDCASASSDDRDLRMFFGGCRSPRRFRPSSALARAAEVSKNSVAGIILLKSIIAAI